MALLSYHVSLHVPSAEVDKLASPYEATEEHESDEIEFTLNVLCSGNETMDVTSWDLQTISSFPTMLPIGQALALIHLVHIF